MGSIKDLLWVFVFPSPWPWPRLKFVYSGLGLQVVFTRPGYRTGNNKSQGFHIMSLSLFLLSEAFVTVIVDRNETKSNLSKKQIRK